MPRLTIKRYVSAQGALSHSKPKSCVVKRLKAWGFKMMTRDEAKDRLAAPGAKVSESASHNTDYVVIGVAPGSEADRARELGITTLDEKDFLELIGARG